MSKIAVIGLGSMGYGMAQSLQRAGHTVDGRDMNVQAVTRFQTEGGTAVPDADLDIAVIVVLNAAQLEAVMDGLLTEMRAGAGIIACPTIPPQTARMLAAKAEAHGLHYLDAPISGGAVKAAAGQLSIMASGIPQAFAVAQPALDAMAEQVFRLGDTAGAGSAMKAINQLLAGVHIAAMGEALTFGATQGVTPAQTLDVIQHCAGTSWMFENRAPHVVDGDYTPRSAVNIWLKDLGIVQDIAAGAGAPVPLVEAALAQYRAAADAGLGHEDDAAVTKVYARAADVHLPGDT